MAAGLLAISLLLFHEYFVAAGWATGWYVVTLLVAVAMTKSLVGSRFLYGLLLLLAAGAGFFALIWIVPALKAPAEPPLLPPSLLPFWLSCASLGYAAAAYVVFFSHRIKRACEKGFTLMDTPKPL